MAIILPEPTNDTERQADEIIRGLETAIDLRSGLVLNQLFPVLYRQLRQLPRPAAVIRCAGVRLVLYLPITQPGAQWAALTLFWCIDPAEITPNMIFHADRFHSLLSSLHTVVTTARPNTLAELNSAANSLARPHLQRTGIPEPPLQLDDLLPLRRGYAHIAQRFFL